MRNIMIAGALALATCGSAYAADLQFPAFNHQPVIDAANVIPDDQEAALDQKLINFYQKTHHQIGVLTVPSLQGDDIEDFSNKAYRHYGISSKERNDGALLVVAPSEHKDRIEVGYGLEGVLTDAQSNLINRNTILPQFKQGDFAGGINAGVDQMIQVATEEQVTPQQVAQRNADRSPDWFQILVIPIGALILGFFLFTLAWFSKRKVRKLKKDLDNDYTPTTHSVSDNLSRSGYTPSTTYVPIPVSTYTPSYDPPKQDDSYSSSSYTSNNDSYSSSSSYDYSSSSSSDSSSSFSFDGGSSGGGGDSGSW